MPQGPCHCSNRDEIDYGTTQKGEPFENPSGTVSRKSVVDLVVKLATTPDLKVRRSLGVHNLPKTQNRVRCKEDALFASSNIFCASRALSLVSALASQSIASFACCSSVHHSFILRSQKSSGILPSSLST